MRKKICKECMLNLSIENFGRNKYSKDGRNNKCNGCRAIYEQLRRNNKNGTKTRIKPIIKNGKKQCLSCFKILSLNKFSPSIRGRFGKSAYCKKCLRLKAVESRKNGRHNKYVKRWREENREKYLSQHIAHQSRRRSGKKPMSSKVVSLLKKETNCFYCHNYTTVEKRTIDHKVPLSRGGTNNSRNLVMACGKCNSSKHNKTASEFIKSINQIIIKTI